MKDNELNRVSHKVHSFNVGDAIKHGADKATILYNLKYWLDHNRANNTNFHDGHWWTYNSAEAFEKLFPYMNAKKIARLLRELEKDGEILVGNYNKKGYDRTKWYSTPCYASLSKNEQCIVHICAMDSPDMSNALSIFAPPIPDSKPNEKPIINTDNTDGVSDVKKLVVISEREVLVNELFNKWLELSGQRIKPTKKRLSHLNARLDDGFTAEQIIDAMTYVATDSWHVDNGQNLIDIAIRSTEQIEKKLIKSTAASKSTNKGHNNESQSHTPRLSAAVSNMARLQAELDAEQSSSNNAEYHDLRTIHGS